LVGSLNIYDQFDIDLTVLTLDDLVIQFKVVDRQYHFIKGKILLEARQRFKSDQDFGKWIVSHSLCVGTQQTRNRLMHLADFFDTEQRDMSGISLTAAYEISAPINREKAAEVYDQAHDKNLSVKEVKALLNNTKDEEAPLPNSPEESDSKEPSSKKSKKYEDEIYLMAVKVTDEIMKNKSSAYKLDVLNRSIQYLEQL